MTTARYRHIHIETNRHGREVIYFRRAGGRRYRLPGEIGSEAFLTAYHAALSDKPIPYVRTMPVTIAATRKQQTERVIRRALKSARQRSAAKGLPFDIDLGYLLDLALRQDFRCALTGIEFFARKDDELRLDPTLPSIDRIKPVLGYVRGNVRLLALAVNTMLLDWGEETFVQIADSYRYWQRTKSGRETPHLEFQTPHLEKEDAGSTAYAHQK